MNTFRQKPIFCTRILSQYNYLKTERKEALAFVCPVLQKQQQKLIAEDILFHIG